MDEVFCVACKNTRTNTDNKDMLEFEGDFFHRDCLLYRLWKRYAEKKRTIAHLEGELAQARKWSAAWKTKAKEYFEFYWDTLENEYNIRRYQKYQPHRVIREIFPPET